MTYPTSYFVTSGVGSSKHQLVSFDRALLNARLGNYNLVKVSSILPASAVRAEKVDLKEGSPLLTAYATISSNSPGTRIATAVAAAIPCDSSQVGVIMEFSGYCTAEEAEIQVRAMCNEAMLNRNCQFKEIISSSIDAIVEAESGYVSLISAISFW